MRILTSIRSKFIISLLPVFLLSISIISYFSYQNSIEHLNDRGRKSLKNVVDMAYTFCESQNRLVIDGRLSIEEAKERVRYALNGPLVDGKRDLSRVRVKFVHKDYLYAINSKGLVEMHPVYPVGSDFSKNTYIKKFVEKKNGVVLYMWRNPGEKSERKKIAYLRYYKPWDWVIGIGAHMDSFTQGARDQLKKSISLTVIFSIIFITFLLLITFSFTSPLIRLRKAVGTLTKENPTPLLGIRSRDEVGELVNTFNKMIKIIREKNFLRDTFGRHISQHLQDAVLTEKISLDGEKKKVTILIINIQDFSGVTGHLSPEELVSFLNDYFSYVVHIILQEEGTIDKYIGDTIMAVFGAPVEHDDDPIRAIRAARLVYNEIEQFNRKRDEMGEKRIQIGIGIHSGEVIAGNIGTNQKMEYTVVGDTIIVTKRIVSLTRFYNTPVLISNSTFQELADEYNNDFRQIDIIQIKNHSIPVGLYEYHGPKNPDEIEMINKTTPDFISGLSHFIKMQWKDAVGFFEKVASQNMDDNIARIYIERCEYFLNNPPPDNWTGVYKSRRGLNETGFAFRLKMD